MPNAPSRLLSGSQNDYIGSMRYTQPPRATSIQGAAELPLSSERHHVSIQRLVQDVESSLGQHVPLPQHGSSASIDSYRRWRTSYKSDDNKIRSLVIIPPDPSAFLTFPTLHQEFSITRSPDDPNYQGLSIEQIGEESGFEPLQLLQPIYSLSGGERVRSRAALCMEAALRLLVVCILWYGAAAGQRNATKCAALVRAAFQFARTPTRGMPPLAAVAGPSSACFQRDLSPSSAPKKAPGRRLPPPKTVRGRCRTRWGGTGPALPCSALSTPPHPGTRVSPGREVSPIQGSVGPARTGPLKATSACGTPSRYSWTARPGRQHMPSRGPT